MKHFFNKPYLLPTLFCLLMLVLGTWVLSPAGLHLDHLASDLRWLALGFAFLFCLFCWLGTSVLNFDEVAWARVDYLWLGLAVLALVLQHNPGPAAALLLMVAVALRAAKAKGEILLKSRQHRTLWLVVGGCLEIPTETLLEMKLQRVKARLTQLLKYWRTARLPMAHVRLAASASHPVAHGAVLKVRPAFRENQFSYDVQQALATSELGRWIARQPLQTIYLFGVIEPALVARLSIWGQQHKVEVIVDGGHSLMVEEERVPHPVTARVSAPLHPPASAHL